MLSMHYADSNHQRVLGPKDANVLRVVLPDERLLHGPISDERNEPLGGWLEFEVMEHELALDQPANLNGWTL